MVSLINVSPLKKTQISFGFCFPLPESYIVINGRVEHCGAFNGPIVVAIQMNEQEVIIFCNII